MTTSYRGYSWDNITYFPAPTEGWNTDTVPWMLAANQASALDNFIIRPGNLKLRGPIVHTASFSNGSGLNEGAICGYTPSKFGGAMVLSTATGGSVMPWDQSVVCTAGNLATAGIQNSTTAPVIRPWVNGFYNPVTLTSTGPSFRWIDFCGNTYGQLLGSPAVPATPPTNAYAVSTSGIGVLVPSQSYLKSARTVAGSPSAATLTVSGAGATVAGTAATFGVTGSFPVGSSQIATVSNLGFNIPTTASVVGVEVDATLSATTPGAAMPAGTNVHETNVKLVIAAGATGADATLGGTQNGLTRDPQHVLYGSPVMDTTNTLTNWAVPLATLTPAVVNATTFGFQMQFANTGTTTTVLPTCTVNSVTVYYALGTAIGAVASFGAAAPEAGVDICAYLNRMWVGQGYDAPGGQAATTHSNTTVFWSNPCSSASNTAVTWSSSAPVFSPSVSAWINPTTGLTNQSKIDNDTTDPIMALAPLRSCLVVLRRKSIWVLTGTTESNFAFQKIADFTGCLDPRSVQVVDSLAYFVSSQGLQVTDGSSVKNVSGGVQYSLSDALAIEQNSVLSGGSGTSGGYVSSALLRGGQYALNVGTTTRVSNGTTTYNLHKQTIWSGVYDPQFGAWTRISSELMTDNVPLQQYSGVGLGAEFMPGRDGSVWVAGNNAVTAWEHPTYGNSVSTGTALFDRSLYLGYAPNAGVGIAARYALIPYRWLTGFPPIVGTTSLDRKWSSIRRYFIDHVFAGQSMYISTWQTVNTLSGNLKMPNGWNVVAVRPDSMTTPYIPGALPLQTTVNSTQTASANPFVGMNASPATASNPETLIQRETVDYPADAADLMFDVRLDPAATTLNTLNQQWAYSQPVNIAGEVYGVGIEFQTGRDLRTKV